jgi:Transcriptional regulators
MNQTFNYNSLQMIIILFAKQYSCSAYNQYDNIGLHPGQVPLLKALDGAAGKSHKELAEELFVKPSTITIAIQRLKKNGLIMHMENSEDLRTRKVFLTEKGRNTLEEAEKIFYKINKQLFFNFSEEDLQLLQSFMQRLHQNLNSITRI